MRFLIHCVALATLAVALPRSGAAANGAYEINQDCIAAGCFPGDSGGYPVTITHPGTYVLTSDISAPGDSFTNAITVLIAPVDIDLQGHKIDGGGTCTGTPVSGCSGSTGYVGIKASNSGSAGVFRIHDGIVRGFGGGAVVITDAGDGSAIERMTFVENGALLNVSIDSSTGSNIVRVRDTQFGRNGGYGLGSSTVTPRFDIENGTFSGNRYGGTTLQAGSVIRNSRFVSNGTYGVLCGTNCALDHDTFDANNAGGAQWSITTLKDMGGNVCFDHACP